MSSTLGPTPFESVAEIEDLTDRRFRTPDRRTGKPFRVDEVRPDGLTIVTSNGGRVRIRGRVFDTTFKVLGDYDCRGDNWMRASDRTLQDLSRFENNNIACLSYVLPLLEAAGRVDLDRERPNKVRLAAEAE